MSLYNIFQLEAQSYIPPVLNLSGQLSLQDLKRYNDQDTHWLHLKLIKMEKHVEQIETFITYEMKYCEHKTKMKLKTINVLLSDINNEFVRLNYYDEKTKNLLLGEVEESINKLKRHILKLESDISTYNTH